MQGARFTSARDALDYILGGKACVTLVSNKTQARFTYEVAKAPDSTFLYFVRVLTGPDNSNDYEYLGTIMAGGGFAPRYRHGTKSRIAPDAPSGLAFSWALRHIAPSAGPQYGELPKDLEVWHEGTCGRCGRRLTTPESLSTGMGPECARRALRT